MVKNPLETTDVLRNLVDLCRNAERGFVLAEEGLTNGEAKRLFRRFAQERGRQAEELETELDRLARGDGQAAAGDECVPCAWTQIRSALNQVDEYGLIALCDEGTDLIVKAYESALETTLPRSTRTLLEKHQIQIKTMQEVLKTLSKMD
jgi:uncharacterized protein (TIGR02284 family)